MHSMLGAVAGSIQAHLSLLQPPQLFLFRADNPQRIFPFQSQIESPAKQFYH